MLAVAVDASPMMGTSFMMGNEYDCRDSVVRSCSENEKRGNRRLRGVPSYEHENTRNMSWLCAV